MCLSNAVFVALTGVNYSHLFILYNLVKLRVYSLQDRKRRHGSAEAGLRPVDQRGLEGRRCFRRMSDRSRREYGGALSSAQPPPVGGSQRTVQILSADGHARAGH